MELKNEFTVDVPVEEAWEILTDVARIAPCLPGAKLQEVDGEEYRGVVKVKVGPVTAEYKGSASFVEQDAGARRAVLRAQGRETRGQGNANATITATLHPAGESTRVQVVTDLAITGRVAQFGRGVLADVSAKLLGQFAASLEETVIGGSQASSDAGGRAGPAHDGAAADDVDDASPLVASDRADAGADAVAHADAGAGVGSAAASNGRVPGVVPDRDVEPVDLLSLAGTATLKRILAPLSAVALVLLAWRSWRRRAR